MRYHPTMLFDANIDLLMPKRYLWEICSRRRLIWIKEYAGYGSIALVLRNGSGNARADPKLKVGEDRHSVTLPEWMPRCICFSLTSNSNYRRLFVTTLVSTGINLIVNVAFLLMEDRWAPHSHELVYITTSQKKKKKEKKTVNDHMTPKTR